ncbi:TIGR01777 family oxidoreductase, partial [Enterobacter intestinihominis]
VLVLGGARALPKTLVSAGFSLRGFVLLYAVGDLF